MRNQFTFLVLATSVSLSACSDNSEKSAAMEDITTDTVQQTEAIIEEKAATLKETVTEKVDAASAQVAEITEQAKTSIDEQVESVQTDAQKLVSTETVDKVTEMVNKTSTSVVKVERDGDKLNLIMPGNLTFPTAGSTLKADSHEVLDSVALVLGEFDKTVISVAGYTDNQGSEAYNQALSEQRANSVAAYLKGKKINPARFEILGFGERNPVADNGTASGRNQNRRVELTLIPKK